MPLKVLIAGGGTGGHVIPALAIARELRDRHQAGVRFLGTARGLETTLVPAAGFLLELIHVGQLKNVSLATRARTLLDLPLGLVRCLRLIRAFGPDAVIGVGGYASGPAMLAALLLRVPTLAFEPNAVPGLANRLVGKWTSTAAVNFDRTLEYFREGRVTGIPVREEFFAVEPKFHGPLRLLVVGGSQGARILNEVVPRIASPLLKQFKDLEIVHQTGARHVDTTLKAYENAGLAPDTNPLVGRIRVLPYLENIAAEFAQADLILCRSGAGAVAELAAAARPAILVPFALAADDHQRANAEVLVGEGAAVMLTERELSPAALLAVAIELLGDRQRLLAMGRKARTLARPDAVCVIGEMTAALAEPHKLS